MKLVVSHHGGTRYDIVSGRHRIVTDQPVEDGGQDAGVSPLELFVGSVASCVAYFVGRFCTRHKISQDGFSVEADWAMAENPHRVGRIDLAIHLSHPVEPDMKERLLKVAHGCTVHQSLIIAPTVDITLSPQNTSMVHQS
jgi:putative redox protein